MFTAKLRTVAEAADARQKKGDEMTTGSLRCVWIVDLWPEQSEKKVRVIVEAKSKNLPSNHVPLSSTHVYTPQPRCPLCPNP